jgi:hypothetical protein
MEKIPIEEVEPKDIKGILIYFHQTGSKVPKVNGRGLGITYVNKSCLVKSTPFLRGPASSLVSKRSDHFDRSNRGVYYRKILLRRRELFDILIVGLVV